MSTLKTLPTHSSVEEFLQSVSNPTRQADSFTLLSLFKQITRLNPQMWGTSIIGFGSYHYKSTRSSQEGDWPLTGFSPRKQSLTIYVMPGFDNYQHLLSRLGKHKTSVGCLYINKLSDVDIDILTQIISQSFLDMKKIHNL